MLHQFTVIQFSKMLGNLGRCLEKAAAHADQNKFDVEVLLQSRLAPDQFNFTRQVQIACDTAKLGVARLTGVAPPVHEDVEKTVGELKARIESVVAFLSSVTEQAFAESEARPVSTPRWGDKFLLGQDYAMQHVIPNFYFHMTTAYSILRHSGVPVGKKDYLGEMPFKVQPS
jgi:hypothetical protein